ncbi:alpha/beta fold hydrolase [Acidovorax sp. GBBC 3334]|uniref:thioesterase II family protein n=1 Tax=Acidovorax sp. GBBC 3334 TaxID=2940496 RepID=UPI0023047886|nr:alpha/beta fold hydrolase [Acidovorax sp. GBBC 3334]MDA8457074.1 alpha/beta fold hydrolase [Acidovorax sp. GBBC 3334]
MARDAALPLVCLPCAGASATMYLRWRRGLPAGVEVAPAELPGRGARMGEPFAKSYGDLVEQLAEPCLRAADGRPFVLFGHSMGALLAYGVARHLQTYSGVEPAALIVSACAAPLARSAERYAEPLDDGRLLTDLRDQGGTPEAVFAEPELLRITLDVLRADYRVCYSFERDQEVRPLSCPIHVFAGRNDRIHHSELLAWAHETRGPATTDWFDGGHFYLRDREPAFLSTLEQRLRPLRVAWNPPSVVSAA